MKQAEAAFDAKGVPHDRGFVLIGATLPDGYTPKTGAKPTPQASVSAGPALDRAKVMARHDEIKPTTKDANELATKLAEEFGVSRNEIIRLFQQK